MYPMMILIQLYYMVSTVWMALGFEGMYYGLCLQIFGQLRLLKLCIPSLNLHNDNDRKIFITKYNSLLKIMNDLKTIFSWVFMFKLVFVLSIACLNVYATVNYVQVAALFIRNITYCMVAGIQIFFFCFIASKITEEVTCSSLSNLPMILTCSKLIFFNVFSL